MLGRIVGAQFALENAIAELSRSGVNTAALAQSQSQLRSLLALQGEVGSASPATLAEMHAQVAATVAATQAMAEQGHAAATGAASAELSRLAADSRDQVTSIIRDMHRFDADLRFGSAEEETAYRQREAERRAYVDAQQAKHTPQGDLNAACAAVGQMADADAHGAGNNPEFKERWRELVTTTDKLRETAKANGVSTEEFDRRLREDLRATMKSKGVSDAEIDAKFAAHPDDPLAAAKDYVSNENDLHAVTQSTLVTGSEMTREKAPTVANTATPDLKLSDAMADFRAAGIVVADHASDAPFAHGVTAQEPAATAPIRTA